MQKWAGALLCATILGGYATTAIPTATATAAVGNTLKDQTGIHSSVFYNRSLYAAPVTTGEGAQALNTVELSYPSAAIDLTVGTRVMVGNKLKTSMPAILGYRIGNPTIAKVTSGGVLMPLKEGATVLTVDVLSGTYQGRLAIPVKVKPYVPVKRAFQSSSSSRTVTVGKKSFTVQTIHLPKGTPATLALAERRVGSTASLPAMASSYKAEAAINGTFFEAYGGPPDPYGNLISDGMAEHIGSYGTTVGFTWDGSARMDALRLTIQGKVAGERSSLGWYAYFMNRTPAAGSTAAIMFTPKRGERIGFAASKAIVVSKGVVTRIATGENTIIPKDGFVLVFQGKEAGQADRFKVGADVTYSLKMTNSSGSEVDWSDVHTAVGAGPRLVKDGKLALNAAAEGFKDEKILTSAGARSGIALLQDGSILLVTVPGATMQQWAQIMVKLGAQQAMNLDGGASSGLWFKGKTLTSTGRNLSNALVFGERLSW